jgi:hypothetical protein
MTREELITISRESGLEYYGLGKDRERFIAHLQRFAVLIAAAENEACAKVCEEVAVDSYTKIGMAHEPYMKATAEDCASHIRARGQA